MQLIFKQPHNCHEANITALRSFKGNIGLFFAVLEKLGKAPFLWYSKILIVQVDFEKKVVSLEIDGQEPKVTTTIPFRELLGLHYGELVAKYMRPFSADLARSWDLEDTSAVIAASGTGEEFDQSLDRCEKRCGKSAEWVSVSLTNILYEDSETPWARTDFFRDEKLKDVVAECREGNYSRLNELSRLSAWGVKGLGVTQEEFRSWRLTAAKS